MTVRIIRATTIPVNGKNKVFCMLTYGCPYTTHKHLIYLICDIHGYFDTGDIGGWMSMDDPWMVSTSIICDIQPTHGYIDTGALGGWTSMDDPLMVRVYVTYTDTLTQGL